MTDKHDFTIEKIKISPVNIDAEDEAGIRETILKLAHGHKKGETEIEVFKEFFLYVGAGIWCANVYIQSAFRGL